MGKPLEEEGTPNPYMAFPVKSAHVDFVRFFLFS
jgi:hypothetical protein